MTAVAGRLAALIAALLSAAALTGCGDNELAQPSAGNDEQTTQAPTPSKYAEDDPEYLLAFIDAGGGSERVPDKTVDRYARLLDKLDRSCRADRSLLADQVVFGVKTLKDEKGLTYSNLQMLKAYSNAVTPSLGRNQKCEDLLAAVLTLTTREE